MSLMISSFIVEILYLVIQFIYMQKPGHPLFEKRTAQYFEQKAKLVNGKDKLLVALELSKYLTSARENGLSIKELEKAGFKFATVPDIKN